MKSNKTTAKNALIEASSQQTRFDPTSSNVQSFFFPSSHNPTRELDIKDINLSINGKPILSDANLHLLPGVKYLLHGQNGTGKSTILKALKERIVPGVPANITISLLQQRDEGDNSAEDENDPGNSKEMSALDLVVQSDRVRSEALRQRALLQAALEDSNDPQAPSRVLKQIKHEKHLYNLELAKKEAELRSGTRGSKARKYLKVVEGEVEKSIANLQIKSDDEEIARETDEAVQLLAQLEAELEMMAADTAHLRAEELLLGLGFTRTSMSLPLSTLSGGWRMRAHLASSLFIPSHILLLDEPTSFLDFTSLLWLEDYLSTKFRLTKGIGTILLLVSHDRSFADKIADETIILNQNLRFEYFNGNLSAFYTERKKQQIRMKKLKDSLEKQKINLEKQVLNNVKMAKKSGDDKKLKQAASRSKKLDERMGLEINAKGGRFKLNRDLAGYHNSKRAEIEIPKDDAAVRMKIPTTPETLRFPGPLLGCEGLSFSYYASIESGRKKVLEPTPIFQDVNLSFRLGEKIGFVGLNGAGKSTLVSCLVGSSSASVTSNSTDIEALGKVSGSITRHPGAVLGYYSQEAVTHLRDNMTALEYLSLDSEQASRSALASLGLSGRAVSDVKIGDLSGGQRVRVALSKILFPITSHVLILDEVTTHLDADTVQVLAGQLRKYKGTLILVSHDRWFLNAVLGEQRDDGEGNTSDFDSSSDSESGTSNLRKEGMVFWVDKGKVKRLQGGIDEFETKVRKRAEKARKKD